MPVDPSMFNHNREANLRNAEEERRKRDAAQTWKPGKQSSWKWLIGPVVVLAFFVGAIVLMFH